jgi:protein-S-isoprenylcysteine O-methyltransferase Ste14
LGVFFCNLLAQHLLMNRLFYPYILVFVQFTCIVFFLVYCGVLAKKTFFQITQLGSVLLAITSFYQISFHNFSIFPKPKQGILLVTKGPYKYIRHPMYLSVLVFCLSILTNNISSLSVIVFIVLLVNLLLKLHYEEALLVKQFPEYGAYVNNSKKLIPYIY